jgi:antitoxin VapB
MALNIKNSEADRLVRELAQVTGRSYTNVVLEALQEKMEREVGRTRAQHLGQDVARIQQRVAQLPVLDPRPPEDILGYNSRGIPA